MNNNGFILGGREKINSCRPFWSLIFTVSDPAVVNDREESESDLAEGNRNIVTSLSEEQS